MNRYMRQPRFALTAFMSVTMAVLAAQQPVSAPGQRDEVASASPFLSKPSASGPAYMDAFDARPSVKSPDGKSALTVTGQKASYRAWVTIWPSNSTGGPLLVWPIQRNVSVLWKPDSKEFALTDNRYANLSFVLVCSDVATCKAEFSAADEEPEPGVAISDLTPLIRNAFEKHAQSYYQTEDFDTRLFYAKALRWTGEHELLVGVSARTLGPPAHPNGGQRQWDFAYVVDVPDKRVVREVDKNRLRSEYQIKVLY